MSRPRPLTCLTLAPNMVAPGDRPSPNDRPNHFALPHRREGSCSEAYLEIDTTLTRDESSAKGPNSLAHFGQEARVLAAINRVLTGHVAPKPARIVGSGRQLVAGLVRWLSLGSLCRAR